MAADSKSKLEFTYLRNSRKKCLTVRLSQDC